jgi:tetratricopeptide (TPR) repeat protein
MTDFYDRLDALYQAGDLEVVEPLIRAHLRHIADTAGDNSPEYAAVLNELGSFLRGVSRYDESEQAFKRGLDILMAQDGYTSQYAVMLMNFAGLYRLTGRADEAVKLFIEAKRLLGASGAKKDLAYAGVLNNLALAYQDAGDYEAALKTALEADELTAQLGTGDHEKAASRNNLAVLCLRAGRLREAEAYIDEALDLYDRMAETDVHHAAALTTKAALLYRAGQYQKALPLFLRATDLTAHFFGKNIEYAAGERHIAMTYEALGDSKNALVHIKSAQETYEQLLGPDHPHTAACRAIYERILSRETPL